MRCGIVIAMTACGPKPPPTVANGAGVTPIVSDAASAAAHAGMQVEVHGTAVAAKLAAAVATGDFIVYCIALPSWPPAVRDKAVVARGTLVHDASFVAQRGPNGEVSQGTGGPVWVLRDCTYDVR